MIPSTEFLSGSEPANYLQQLVNDYEAVAGVKVNVVQEPWPSFATRTFAEFAAQGQSYDMNELQK